MSERLPDLTYRNSPYFASARSACHFLTCRGGDEKGECSLCRNIVRVIERTVAEHPVIIAAKEYGRYFCDKGPDSPETDMWGEKALDAIIETSTALWAQTGRC